MLKPGNYADELCIQAFTVLTDVTVRVHVLNHSSIIFSAGATEISVGFYPDCHTSMQFFLFDLCKAILSTQPLRYHRLQLQSLL